MTFSFGQLTSATWDARTTADGKVSVIDVISDISGKDTHYASNTYKRLVVEERVPKCGLQSLPPRKNLNTSPPGTAKGVAPTGSSLSLAPTGRGGARAGLTPVATVAEMTEIIWQLPGTAEFRRNCSHLVVRFLGGDPSLVDEIKANQLPATPARPYSEAQQPLEAPEERALKLRRLSLENDRMQKENDELERRNIAAARQALLDAGETLDDAQCGYFRDRMSNLIKR
jgi:hypothetical protein